MSRILTGLGLSLILWGVFVLVTGDFVATVDIAAGLVGSGSAVIAFGVIAQALDRIAQQLAERPLAPPVPQIAPERRPAVRDERRQADEDERRPVPERERSRERPPAPARAPEPAPPPRQPEPEAPTLVREGMIDGRLYRFFSDGSIEAEGPRGVRRYRSIEEAREHILRDRDQPEPSFAPPGAAEPPGAPRAPQGQRPRSAAAEPPAPPLPGRSPPPPAARTAKPPQAGNVTWDSYLAGGGSNIEPGMPTPSFDTEGGPGGAEDDEWSEPFRMLLKGDGSENIPDGQKPLRR